MLDRKRLEEITQLSLDLGLDPFPLVYEELESTTMYNVGAYGLPTRARHWSYGRSYDHQKMSGQMGFSKVYEMVVNNNPSYAFMLDSNSDVENMLIVAHVNAHSDFFKNNVMFKDTNRNMVRHAADHAGRIEKYIEQYGFAAVERIMDIGFALDRHLDWYKGQFRKPYQRNQIKTVCTRKRGEFDDLLLPNSKFEPTKKYVDKKFPPHPEKDLLWFLANYAPLEEWEKDVLDIMREEAYYFYPQMMTKILNEGWACLCPGSLVFSSENGLINIENVVENETLVLDRNGEKKLVSDVYSGSKKCLKITTKRGLSLSGAQNHGVLAYDKYNNTVWRKIKDISIGDKIIVSYNQDCWGQKIKKLPTVELTGRERDCFNIPKKLNKKVAKFIGYFFAEGNIGNRSVVLTNGDLNVANDMAKNIFDVFGYKCYPRKDGTRYRVEVYSQAIINLLNNLGLGGGSRNKQIPDVLLQSPKRIVLEFLSSAFCGDGGAYEGGDILALSTGVKRNAEVIQILLLNLGIISSITKQMKIGYEDCFQVWICESVMKNKFRNLVNTPSSKRNAALDGMKYDGKNNFKWSYPLTSDNLCKIKNGLVKTTQREQKKFGVNYYHINKYKRATLNQINALENLGVNVIDNKNYFVDEVTEISMPFYSKVHDFTVPDGHEYQAQGFVNHNSFWHAETMFKYNLTPEEHLEFCKTHEKVVQPGGGGRINPYYLGFKIFKDIEKRWDKLHKEGKSEITGREKIFQVRAEENDISFIRNYLTKELVDELKLFTYGYVEDYPEDYDNEMYIEVKEVLRDHVVEALISPLYNGGVPKIVITGVGAEGTLLMRHDSEERGTLDFKFAEKVLEYIWDLWAAPIELSTKDDDGEEVTLCFDEAGFFIRNFNEDDDEDDIEEPFTVTFTMNFTP